MYAVDGIKSGIEYLMFYICRSQAKKRHSMEKSRRNTNVSQTDLAYFGHGPDAFFAGMTGMVPEVMGSSGMDGGTRKAKKGTQSRRSSQMITKHKPFQYIGPHEDLYRYVLNPDLFF